MAKNPQGYEALLWILAFYVLMRGMPQDDQNMINRVDCISQTLFTMRFSQNKETMAKYRGNENEALLGWTLAFYELMRRMSCRMPQDDQNTVQDGITIPDSRPEIEVGEDRNTWGGEREGRADPIFQRLRDNIPSAFKEKKVSYPRGSCQNCGLKDHEKKDCFERPKAKYQNKPLEIGKKAETKTVSSSVYGSTSLSKPQLVSSRANNAPRYLLKEELPKPEPESFCSAQGGRNRSAWDHPPTRVPIVGDTAACKDKKHTDQATMNVAEDFRRHELGEEQREDQNEEEGRDDEFGRWEQHTKGFGSKMLNKMGIQTRQGPWSPRTRYYKSHISYKTS